MPRKVVGGCIMGTAHLRIQLFFPTLDYKLPTCPPWAGAAQGIYHAKVRHRKGIAKKHVAFCVGEALLLRSLTFV